MPKENVETKFGQEATRHLVGKRIRGVRWMTDEEVAATGFFQRPLIIELEDDTYLFASRDEEGNDAGCLFGGNYQYKTQFTIPSL